MSAETRKTAAATVQKDRAEISVVLGRALDWGALHRDRYHEDQTKPSIGQRDVVALGLIAQIIGVDTLHCIEPGLAEGLQRPEWLDLCEVDKSTEAAETLVLAPVEALAEGDAVQLAEAGAYVVLTGLREWSPIPVAGIRLRPLATINPAFWASDLAFLIPADPRNIDRLITRLAACLGEQSLDPLALYEEVCRLRETGPARVEQSQPAHDLVALRRYIRGLIERAAITARRESARAKPGVAVDWASAFLVPAEFIGTVRGVDLNEAEVRARRARIEAEFLRGQLRAVSIPRNVDHHDLIAGSGFFDIAWYAETYGVIPEDAVRNYLDGGVEDERDPSPYFSNSAYFAAYPDVRKHGFNPLLHYLMDGIYEGRAIDPPSSVGEAVWQDGFD